MHKEIVWALIATALGICSGQNSQDENLCLDTPKFGRGREVIKGWSYNSELDKCYVFDHAKRDDYSNENIFLNESACNKRCRPHVPEKCYAKPPPSMGTLDLPVTTYDPSTGRCLEIRAPKDQGANVFNNKASCIKQCRDVDLRLCLKPTEKDCEYIDGWGYRYDSKDQTCKKATDGSCGGFQSAEDCFRRCGVLVDNKCTLPIQTTPTCENPQQRYGYNNKTKRCEEFLGCADGGNSFKEAETCWKDCAPAINRCNMKPDTGRNPNFGFFKRYYYDIKTNLCSSARKVSRSVPGNTNLFKTALQCEEICKPKYQGNLGH
ncbi:actinia tenebrosa protease inhibitors isoform X1 [Ixodes scapularis]|uniref:actinia tenebrosa protease inhibitors isoform X1 n=1 Tax=Ixodes scapularis TaxID=6945 RepID=UPI001A9DCE42|nr:actinia tenebrosa protease inhibitors isoform X1 [Ixodes scapularis]